MHRLEGEIGAKRRRYLANAHGRPQATLESADASFPEPRHFELETREIQRVDRRCPVSNQLERICP